jgi:preprotein translocase subunit SecD
VKGFAFTLGLTTLIDLAVVWLFTYPSFRLLAQTKFFSSGHKLSGLELRESSGFGYTGRGQFRVAPQVSAGKAAKASKEAERRQTIAERKAAVDNQNSSTQEESN